MIFNKKAQSLLEYIIIIGIVMTGVYFMAPAFKRGTQSVIKATADQLGTQENSEQDFSPDVSHMTNSMTSARVNSGRSVQVNGEGFTTLTDETTQTFTNTVTESGTN